jgi:hypothetical protein
MLERPGDQILKILNAVPELWDDPRFDVLRWWLLFVLVAVLLFVVGMVRRAYRKKHRS